jgi:hypothetical protein
MGGAQARARVRRRLAVRHARTVREGKDEWECEMTILPPDTLLKPQKCHRVSLLSLPLDTTEGKWHSD